MISGATYRSGTYAEGDDTMTIEACIQVADSEINEDASQHEFSFGSKGCKVIVITGFKITLQRDNAEKPELCVFVDADTTKLYSSSDGYVGDFLCIYFSRDIHIDILDFSYPAR